MKKIFLSALVLMLSSGFAISQTNKSTRTKAASPDTKQKSEVSEKKVEAVPVNQAVKPVMYKGESVKPTNAPEKVESKENSKSTVTPAKNENKATNSNPRIAPVKKDQSKNLKSTSKPSEIKQKEAPKSNAKVSSSNGSTK